MRWERKEEKSNKFSSYLFNLFPHPPVPCHRVPIPQVLVSDTRGVGGSSHKMLWQVQSLGTWWHCGRAGDQPRELRLCWAKGCPEPESDVDQEDEGDLEFDILLLHMSPTSQTDHPEDVFVEVISNTIAITCNLTPHSCKALSVSSDVDLSFPWPGAGSFWRLQTVQSLSPEAGGWGVAVRTPEPSLAAASAFSVLVMITHFFFVYWGDYLVIMTSNGNF